MRCTNHYISTMRCAIVLIFFCCWVQATAQTWHNVGNAGFSTGTANYTSLALDTGGTPYVAYQDASNGNKATVMRYIGGAWVTVGDAGFSEGAVYNTTIVLDNTGVPYVAFRDVAHANRATVMKYDNSSWVKVGLAGFSAVQAYYVSLAISNTGVPFVTYQDYAESGKATVMKYNGTAWVKVGVPGFSIGQVEYTNIAINSQGDPYVVYEDFAMGNRVSVMKFDGAAWINVGTPGFSAGAASYPTIAIDKNDTPFVAFNSSGANVFKFNGSSWVQVGFPNFSGPESFTSIAIADSGVVYVAGSDLNYSSRAFVSVYDTTLFHTWTSVSGFASTDAANFTSLKVNKQGTPYLAYSDGQNGYRASVMVFSIVSGIDELAFTEGLTIYPNPSNDFVEVKSPVGGMFRIRNLLGQVVNHLVLAPNIPGHLAKLEHGYYLIEGQGMVGKLLVQ